jgi:hypothetical protein
LPALSPSTPPQKQEEISAYDLLAAEVRSEIRKSSDLHHLGRVDRLESTDENERGKEKLLLGHERLKLIRDGFEVLPSKRISRMSAYLESV